MKACIISCCFWTCSWQRSPMWVWQLKLKLRYSLFVQQIRQINWFLSLTTRPTCVWDCINLIMVFGYVKNVVLFRPLMWAILLVWTINNHFLCAQSDKLFALILTYQWWIAFGSSSNTYVSLQISQAILTDVSQKPYYKNWPYLTL